MLVAMRSRGDAARRGAPVAIAIATLAATGACAALVGLPDVPDLPVARSDADASDGSADGAEGSLCPPTTPPARPASDDPSSNGEQTFIVAMRTLDMGFPPDGGSPVAHGYDLDHVATCCQAAPESCVSGTATAHCDGDGGIDNSGGQFVADIQKVAPAFSDTEVSQHFETGLYTVLFQVQHYNGTANDTQVTVGVLASHGIDGPPDAATPPKWDGTDTWTVDSDDVFDPSARPITPGRFDSHAYVAGGVLVGAVDFPMSLGASGGSRLVVSLTGTVVTANVVAGGGGTFRFEGAQVAGRWSTHAFLAELPSIYAFGAFICRSTNTYATLKPLICKAADVTGDPSLDRTGATCDALSLAFGFTAFPAQFGRVLPPAPRPQNCPDAGPDDCAR
jgi:hypothetical protein